MTTAQETPLQPDFRERAKSNDVAVARLIGFEAKEIGDGRATVTLSAGPRHANPMGTLTAGFCGTLRTPRWEWRSQARSYRRGRLKINFFRPVWQARLTAEGRVVQRGRTMGYVECEITDEENRLVAKASTCTVLRGQKKLGR